MSDCNSKSLLSETVKSIHWGIIISCFLISSAAILGQGDYKYKLRGGNREEGIKSVPRASYDLKVISFLSHNEKTVLASSDSISVKFFVKENKPLFITASELTPVHDYYMQPVKKHWSKGWQVFNKWPAGGVLLPLNIQLQQLGLVGKLEKDFTGNGILVPLLVYINNSPDKVSKYEMRIVSREILSKLSYKIFDNGGRRIMPDRQLRKNFPAGNPILISFDLSGMAEGYYKLEIKGKIKNLNEGPKRSYTFYHKPTLTK